MTNNNSKKRKAEELLKNQLTFDQFLYRKIYQNPITANFTFYEPRYFQLKNQTVGYAKVTQAESAVNHINFRPARVECHLESLNRAFKCNPPTQNVIPGLLDLNDDLILLLLENISIDYRFHRLKFRFCDLDPAPNQTTLQLATFASSTRVIEIKIHSVDALYKPTVIHEMAHALAYFMFRSPDDANPSLYPFPLKNMYAKNKSSDEKFNPAELKFRHCVREDKKRLERLNADKLKRDARLIEFSIRHQLQLQPLTQENLMDFVLGPLLGNFFNRIETSYETTIQEQVGLGEVFSFYMQYRAQCLEFAAANEIASDRVLDFIKNKLPLLHDYFVTDIKRLMQNRLLYFMSTYKLAISHSHYFTRYTIKAPAQALWMAQQDTNKLFRGFWAENLSRMYWSMGCTGKLHPITSNANSTSEQADFVHGWRQHFTP